MASSSWPSLPILLPDEALYKGPEPHEWKSQKDTNTVQPPPPEDAKTLEMEAAAAKQLIDGKMLKKTRPRRTVDYNSGLGRWDLVSTITFTIQQCMLTLRVVAQIEAKPIICTIHETGTTVRHRREYTQPLVDVLFTHESFSYSPPKAYPTNSSTSLCTKWVHSSTNKIRYPVNCVTVRQTKMHISHSLTYATVDT